MITKKQQLLFVVNFSNINRMWRHSFSFSFVDVLELGSRL